MRAFLQRYERLVESSTRLSLELLCERILVEHDYDLAVLTRRDGQRRYANLRKLARLARSYEELRGPDIEGFIRFVAEQDAVGAPERDAVSEEEGADAVRLLTIHAAKGLEFKVVVVADAGRERSRTDEILCLSDGRFGFKVAHPSTGSRVSTTSYQAVKETQDEAEDAERLRLYYVAMTRAMDRLIVSGSVDRSSERDERTPIGWVLERLGLGEELDRADASGPVEVERGNAAVVLRIDRFDPASAEAAAPVGRAGARRRGGPARALRRRRRGDPGSRTAAARARRDPGAAARPRRAALVQRDLALRPLRLPLLRRAHRRHAAGSVGAAPAVATGPGGLHPTEIGDAVHRLLELVDLASPVAPGDVELEALVRGWYPTVSEEEIARIGELVRSYTGSALAARIAGLRGVRPERPFAFELDGVLVNGRLDVLWLEGERALVLDYKTNALLGRDPAEIVEEEYLTQQIVYAIACLRAGATRGRGRLPLPRGSGRRRLEDLHGRGRSAARGRAQRLDRPDPGGRVPADAERLRLLGLPGARTSSAPGRGSAAATRCVRARVRLGRVASGPCGSQRCTTSTATCRRSRPCLPIRGLREVDLIVSGGDLVAGPMPSACLDLLCGLRLSGAVRARERGSQRPRAERGVRRRRGARPSSVTSASPTIAEWPLTVELDVAGGATFCHATPRFGRRSRHAADARRRARGGARRRSDAPRRGRAHAHAGRPASPATTASSSPAASGRPYEGRQGAFWALLGDDVELLRTDYDIESAAAAIRATGFPDAEEHAENAARAASARRGLRVLREPPWRVASSRRRAAAASGRGKQRIGPIIERLAEEHIPTPRSRSISAATSSC